MFIRHPSKKKIPSLLRAPSGLPEEQGEKKVGGR